MKLEDLRQKLIVSAREVPVDDRVPYGFEKRIIALLSAQPIPDLWALWSRALWRAAVPCLVVMVALVAMSQLVPVSTASKPVVAVEEFPQDFEQTMLAVVDQPGEVW